MSAAAAILTRLRTAGVSIAVAGGKVLLNGPEEALGDDILDEVRTHKPEILELLKTPELSPEGLITEWRASIAGVHTDLLEVAKLKTVSLRFLDSANVAAAIDAGWNATSLFGVHRGGYQKERLDAWGLTAFLAWGTHSHTIQAFTREECSLLTRSGSLLKLQRVRPNHDQAVPFWMHPALADGGSR
jgi:hypothetical protein